MDDPELVEILTKMPGALALLNAAAEHPRQVIQHTAFAVDDLSPSERTAYVSGYRTALVAMLHALGCFEQEEPMDLRWVEAGLDEITAIERRLESGDTE